MATNFRRRILGGGQQHRSSIDRRMVEKIWKQMDRLIKSCQMPKMNLNNSPPYLPDILPDLHQILKQILAHYNEQMHLLNDIEYIRIFLENLMELCTKTSNCFKQAGQMIYDEQSTYRKDLIKYSLYFAHNLTEMRALFHEGMYIGERFRLTKDEAKDFWKNHFDERTIVPWEEFKDKLQQNHSDLTPDETIALQNTMDLTNNNHISIFEFDVFTRLFYPWSSLLTNWKLLTITHPGYMAFLTYEEVKAILMECIDKPGSYLFRLSCTRLGQWAIGYVTKDKTILQTIPQTKPLIQSLIDGEREGFYKYPIGRNIQIDLSGVLKPVESNRIDISEEQFSIYSNMDTSFELCKICSVNNKNSQIQPCGHLLCQNCLIAWQNQNNSKPPSLCPFCRSEIKGFQSVVIKPFDHSLKSINKENANLDSPPPIPPRPVNLKCHTRQIPAKNEFRRFDEILPPPLHNNHVLLLPPSLTSSFRQSNETIEDIRNRLREEFPSEIDRIDAALILTDGLTLSKQYAMAKFFLCKVKHEQEQFFHESLEL